MTESTSQQAVLADVALEVFQKFCQFAYTGSYSAHEVVASEEANSKPSTADYNSKTSFDLKPPRRQLTVPKRYLLKTLLPKKSRRPPLILARHTQVRSFIV